VDGFIFGPINFFSSAEGDLHFFLSSGEEEKNKKNRVNPV